MRVCAGCEGGEGGEGGEGAGGPCPARQLPEAPGTEGCSPSRGLASEPAVDASLNMGCSLCSLRKPEEQYRLLYEVCQVTMASSSPGRGHLLGKESESLGSMCVLNETAGLSCIFPIKSCTFRHRGTQVSVAGSWDELGRAGITGCGCSVCFPHRHLNMLAGVTEPCPKAPLHLPMLRAPGRTR